MTPYVIVFLCTLLACVTLVLTQPLHGRYSLDSAVGIQKVHTRPTARIGGVAVLLGLCVAWLITEPKVSKILGHILLAGIPAFAVGLLEDLTKKVSALIRLFATMCSGVLAWLISGVAMRDTGFFPLDWVLSFTVVAVLFTAFAVAGVANAINIIDGFNGLAGGSVLIMLSAIGVISLSVGDIDLATVCFLCAAIALGFCAVNWPSGRLFLGDGGAYLLGFMLAWMAVKLPMRHVDINAWATLLICTYPVLEVGFSVRRRRNRMGRYPTEADKVHLHHLIHRRIIRKLFPSLSRPLQNGLTSPVSWAATAAPCAWAIAFSQSTLMLALGFAGFVLAYAGLYARLSQFCWCFSARTLHSELVPSNLVLKER